jgi:hypothetical protein
MYPESEHTAIERAIGDFAVAYGALEKLQEQGAEDDNRELLLPRKGDQKTGLIGEYWAMRYARLIFKGTVTFGHHSQKGWDLKVATPDEPIRYIQVKTASAFGEGKVSPICEPTVAVKDGDKREMPNYWDELWMLWMNERLLPEQLWRLKPENITFDHARLIDGSRCLTGKIIRRPGGSGSECFAWDKAEAVTDIRAKLGIA